MIKCVCIARLMFIFNIRFCWEIPNRQKALLLVITALSNNECNYYELHCQSQYETISSVSA